MMTGGPSLAWPALALLAWGCASSGPKAGYPPFQPADILDSMQVVDGTGTREMFYLYDLASLPDTVFTNMIYQGTVNGRHVFRLPGEMSWEAELAYRILLDEKQCRVANPRSLNEEWIQFGKNPRKPVKAEGQCRIEDPLVY